MLATRVFEGNSNRLVTAGPARQRADLALKTAGGACRRSSARGRDVVDLLVRAGLRLGDVDDLQDLGTAEAGDLHGTHARKAKSWSGRTRAPPGVRGSPTVDRVVDAVPSSSVETRPVPGGIIGVIVLARVRDPAESGNRPSFR
jgi:hypothetical protein